MRRPTASDNIVDFWVGKECGWYEKNLVHKYDVLSFF
jgi:hypothetical protein